MAEVRTPAGGRVSSRYHICTTSLGPVSGWWRLLPLAENNGECRSIIDRPPVHLHWKLVLVQSISERCRSMRTDEWHRRCRITSLCRVCSRSPLCIQTCVNLTWCLSYLRSSHVSRLCITDGRNWKQYKGVVNEINLVHKVLSIFSSILFITSTCFGPLQVHQQENNCIYTTLGISFCCIASCLVCRINPAHQTASYTE